MSLNLKYNRASIIPMEKESKLYEVAFIISPNLGLEGAQNLNQKTKNAVQDLGGLIEEEGEVSERRLAYEISGARAAFLAHFKFSIAPDKIDEFKTGLGISEILRFLIVSSERTPVRTMQPRTFVQKSAEPMLEEEQMPPTQIPEQPTVNIEEIDKKLEEILGK
jgi:ribosomal protein S6